MIKKNYPSNGKNLIPATLLTAGLLWVGLAQGQTSQNASGGDATGSGGSVAYSVGKLVYAIHSDSGGSVTQGVHHPYEIYTLSIQETAFNISLIAFPNPTTDQLTLQIKNYNNEKLMYRLYDLQGRLLDNGTLKTQQTQIDMSSVPSAIYFLNVVNKQNKKIQSFKILKN